MTRGQMGLSLFPSELDTPEFRDAWAEWLADRVERKLPRYTARATAIQFRRLSEMGADRAIAAINYSISQCYKGIFEPPAAIAKPKQLSIWEIKEKLKAIDNELDAVSVTYWGHNADEVNLKRQERKEELLKQRKQLKAQLIV